ncbi:MAG: dihydrolipoamide acetyltransferase family protein [Vampirovibrionales bacterium]|nr:dihydrolipoamide acetyltransferase family protein [Vampirovibrionales bacterium]
MSIEFRLPDIGEGIHEGEIVQWLVNVGDNVKEDQPVLEVMTDKVTAEIPSPVSGVVKELRAKAGEVVKVGSVVIVFDDASAPQKPEAPAKSDPRAVEFSVGFNLEDSETTKAKAGTVEKFQNTEKMEKTAAVAASSAGAKVLAAPATRKVARALGVDLSTLSGTGVRGRITPEDVKRYGQGASFIGSNSIGSNSGLSKPASNFKPQPVAASAGDRRVPFAGMRKKIAEHLVKSKQTVPHFAYVEEVDMSNLMQMRRDLKADAEAQGVKLSFLPFIIKAVVAGLRQYPVLNSQLDETTQELVYKGDIHMGIAVATDDGLVVPVIKHADQKNLLTLAAEIQTLSEKARANKLSLDEIRGGTFTLTSIGSIGGLFGVPIINHPEVAIMGINKITERPVVRNGEIVIRDMMNLSLSGDHRVVDGAEAALFTKAVIEYLENPAKLLLV